LPDAFADEKAVVPILAARIAKYIGLAVVSDGSFVVQEHILATAYEQAIEVVAREWRASPNAGGPSTMKLTETAANMFSGLRENRFVLDAQKQLRPAAELLACRRHLFLSVVSRQTNDESCCERRLLCTLTERSIAGRH
jgi:hypothetical protein